MQHLQKQLDNLKIQSREDFRFVMLALATAKQGMDEVRDRLDEVSRQLGHMHGRMGSQEERFEAMLDIVQKMLDEVGSEHVHRADLEELRISLESRLEALEKKIDSAA